MLKRYQPPPRPTALPVYGIAAVAAAASMAQGGVWASLGVFGLSLLAAVVVEAMKLKT